MSICLSMSSIPCSSRIWHGSSSNSVTHFQNPTATLRSLPFSLRAALKKGSPFILSSSQPLNQTKKPQYENFRTRAADSEGAAAEAVEEEKLIPTASEDEAEYDESYESDNEQKKDFGVVVRPLEKPRLVLKFVWLEKNIGLALDQAIPGYGTIPLSPYYFWPRKDAWEELKTTLESKPWISQKRMIILLNQATDIINLWQQSGGNL